MIDKILPIEGWKAVGIEYDGNECTVKYKHEDLSYLMCPRDGLPGPTIHRRYSVYVRDLPIGIYHTTLEVEVLECWCPKCRRFHTVRPSELHYSMRLTWRLMTHISRLVKEGSTADVTQIYKLSENTVRRANRAVLEYIDFTVPVQLDGLDAIVVDEKFLGSKLKFVTVVSDRKGQLLYLGEGKGADALKGFFDMLSEEQKASIKVVGADRSNAYTKAVNECLPHADICYDRFHIVKNLNDAVTKVRRKEFNRKDEKSKVIKGARYLLLRNPEDIDESGKEQLAQLLKLNENISKAHMLKEDLRQMYMLKNEDEASTHLNNWLKMAEESGLAPFVTLAKRFRKQAASLLAYFRHKLTSGVIEGLNSKIAKIQFQMRGISTPQYLYLKLRESTCAAFREKLKQGYV